MKSFNEALDAFRKLVALLYREVGAMRPENHPSLYGNSKLATCALSKHRKQRARELYCATRSHVDVETILRPYQEETGLSLEQIREAFRNGDWLLGASHCSFGGPQWASIADLTLDLHDAILNHDDTQATTALRELPHLHHNHGRIVDKFPELHCG